MYIFSLNNKDWKKIYCKVCSFFWNISFMYFTLRLIAFDYIAIQIYLIRDKIGFNYT